MNVFLLSFHLNYSGWNSWLFGDAIIYYRGPWQLFARGPYLRETKTYLNCNSRMQCMGTSNMYDYQHNTTISVQYSSSLSQLQ